MLPYGSVIFYHKTLSMEALPHYVSDGIVGCVKCGTFVCIFCSLSCLWEECIVSRLLTLIAWVLL